MVLSDLYKYILRVSHFAHLFFHFNVLGDWGAKPYLEATVVPPSGFPLNYDFAYVSWQPWGNPLGATTVASIPKTGKKAVTHRQPPPPHTDFSLSNLASCFILRDFTKRENTVFITFTPGGALGWNWCCGADDERQVNWLAQQAPPGCRIGQTTPAETNGMAAWADKEIKLKPYSYMRETKFIEFQFLAKN